MSVFCESLPSRLEWRMFGGDFSKYEEALYEVFKRDFLRIPLTYMGKPVDIIHEKYYNRKERSFWHIITAGEEDFRRAFDEDRCGSMPWARALITEQDACESYKMWIKWHDKTKRDRYYIWCSKVNYLVVLEDRDTYFKIITAFNLNKHSISRYQKDYETYLKKRKRPPKVGEISAPPTLG